MKFATAQEVEDFYNNGFIVRKFVDTPIFRNFKSMLTELRDGSVRDGYAWSINKSYRERCQDFKPDIYTYNTCLLDLWKDQNIHEIVGEITGQRDHFLGFVKLRWNLQGKAYTSWHRDTNYYNGKIKGATPSLIGLNYYPSLGEVTEKVLQVWPGSHHRMSRYQCIDRMAVFFGKREDVYTNDETFLLFDTAVIHKLMPIHSKRGSLRIISQYSREFQLEEHYKGKEDLHAMYRAILK